MNLTFENGLGGLYMLEGQNGHFIDYNILTIKLGLTCGMLNGKYFY